MDNGHYMDYIGHGYPFGLRLTLPLVFKQSLDQESSIRRVFPDTVDEHYCQEALRKDYLDAGLISSVYSEEEVNED